MIEKAVNYSLTKEGKLKTIKGKIYGKKYLYRLDEIKKKVYPYIDLDGEIFDKIMKSKGARQRILLNDSEKIVVDTGKACLTVFSLAKKGESGIKKSIISDFYIGLACVKAAFLGCLFNLEGNVDIFKRKSKYIDIFKKGVIENGSNFRCRKNL